MNVENQSRHLLYGRANKLCAQSTQSLRVYLARVLLQTSRLYRIKQILKLSFYRRQNQCPPITYIVLSIYKHACVFRDFSIIHEISGQISFFPIASNKQAPTGKKMCFYSYNPPYLYTINKITLYSRE